MITDVLEESYEAELESFEEDFKKMLEVSDYPSVSASVFIMNLEDIYSGISNRRGGWGRGVIGPRFLKYHRIYHKLKSNLSSNCFLNRQTYFKYIQSWMTGLMGSPEMSKRLKNVLEEEWNFTKFVCPHVRGGEANAGNWFW